MMKYFNRVIFVLSCLIFSATSLSQENLRLENIWINEAPPNVTVLAAYGRVINLGKDNLKLERIESPDFAHIEIHQSVTEQGVAKMLKQSSLEIKANSTTELKPGDLHMMLFEPSTPVKQGNAVPMTFYFSDGSVISVEAKVEKYSDNSHQHHHH